MMVLLISILTQLTSSAEIVLLFKAQIKILCCDLMTMCLRNVKKASKQLADLWRLGHFSTKQGKVTNN